MCRVGPHTTTMEKRREYRDVRPTVNIARETIKEL